MKILKYTMRLSGVIFGLSLVAFVFINSFIISIIGGLSGVTFFFCLLIWMSMGNPEDSFWDDDFDEQKIYNDE